MIVQKTDVSLPENFGFDTAIPADIADSFIVSESLVNNRAFQAVGLGVSDLTGSTSSVAANTLEVKPGVTLDAQGIILGAKSAITLDSGSEILALALSGAAGQAAFISPSGTLDVGADTVVHASSGVSIRQERCPRPHGAPAG